MSTKTRKPKNLPRITDNEFTPGVFQKRLIAKSLDAAEKFVASDDPPEMRIIINEFSYNLEEMRYNFENLIYWLSWAFEWEKINQKKNKEFLCCVRDINGIERKHCRDFIWIFWEVILCETNKRNNEILTKQVRSLYEFFKMKFTPGKKRKRVYLILQSLELLNINIDSEYVEKNPIMDRYHLMVQACGNINQLYKEKKANENLTSDAVNSKMKQEATFVVTKYQDLSLLDDFPNKEKPDYLKARDNPRDLTSKKKEKKNTQEISQEKFDLVSQIDTFMLSNGKNPPKKTVSYEPPRQINEEKNKTVSLINEIESKLNKRKKKNKDVTVSVQKKIIDL